MEITEKMHAKKKIAVTASHSDSSEFGFIIIIVVRLFAGSCRQFPEYSDVDYIFE